MGIDSAEPSLVRELIARGELPSLAALLERGSWAEVDSRGDLGSGAVWPTFFTGTDPSEHGMCSGWIWEPRAMQCVPPDELAMTPFWEPLSREADVGILDVPLAPVGKVSRGFELAEWGPHDALFGEVLADRPEVGEIVARMDPHPFTRIPYGPGVYDEVGAKLRLASACIDGAGRRAALATRLLDQLTPAMALVVFTEVHHVTHQMWHTVAPDAPVYEGLIGDRGDVNPNLVDVYREIDRQLEAVIEAAGPDAAVAVFSLHGMGPAPGIPTLLDPLLSALGYAAPAGWSGSSWRDRGVALFAAAKRRAPSPIRSAYRRLVSHRAAHRIARSTMVAPHDWSRTRAFALPSDQHGYVRVNLAGREAQGAVPESEYGAICDELVDSLTRFTDDAGRPLVDRLVRTANGGEPPNHLPDIVVHWSEAGFARPVRIAGAGFDLEAHPIRPDMTGGHRDRGFCILDERLAAGSTGDVVRSPELQRLLLAGFSARPAAERT